MALPVNGSTHLIPAYYSFIDSERMKGWVGLVGWPVADGLPTLVVTHQLQVERRTGKVRRPEIDVLPLCHATMRWRGRVKAEGEGGSGARLWIFVQKPRVFSYATARCHQTTSRLDDSFSLNAHISGGSVELLLQQLTSRVGNATSASSRWWY